jgi:hypothetical protein
MNGRLARLDHFGHLSAPFLLQGWIGGMLVLHGISLAFALFLYGPPDRAILAALVAGLALAGAARHPAVKLALLAAWVGWWTYRFAYWPGFDFAIALMMAMSLYVIARVALAWGRDGTQAVRVGRGYPPSERPSWPELAGLTKRERRLVLRRARARAGRPAVSMLRTPAFWIWTAVLLAISLLELYWFPPPAGENGVRIARSTLAWLVIVPLLLTGDPEDRNDEIRRALREHVLPEFEQQPWLRDAARRAERTGSAR